MDQTVTAEYEGWEIEIRCNIRVDEAGDAPRVKKYTATAHASLIDHSQRGDLWIDARTQVVGLGSRYFPTCRQCVDALLSDVKELIDALKR